MKQQYKVWYRVQDNGSYVEVSLIVETVEGETLVFQKEGEFNSMDEASPLINYLEESGAEVEYVETVPYTK
jgi:hypothetical protein